MQKGPEYLNSRAKRNFDILGAATVGFALLPTWAFSYGAAAIDNKSLKPFFRHERIGNDGMLFTVTKLRTLRPEKATEAYRSQGAYDTRASGIGLALRRYGLDEIPQLRSVASGEMSLIGARASSSDSLAYLQEAAPDIFDEWYERAYSAGKPALIGPAQIYRHKFVSPTEENYRKSLQMDIDYAARASLIGDIRMLGSAPLKLLAANIWPIKDEPAGIETVAQAAAL